MQNPYQDGTYYYYLLYPVQGPGSNTIQFCTIDEASLELELKPGSKIGLTTYMSYSVDRLILKHPSHSSCEHRMKLNKK